MILTASTIAEVIDGLAATERSGAAISGFALSAMNRVLEYTPEDMTVTVEAGITLAGLQTHLAQRTQWLPIDPPNPESLTIGALLAANKSGPRRFGFGTIREHLLGIKVVLADGRLVKAGGKVVKNVAGYDLCKLFVGSRGTLGVMVEATFKVLPRPEAEQFVQLSAARAGELRPAIEAVNASAITPVVLDLCGGASSGATLVLGFAGAREDVEFQLDRARRIGFSARATLDHDANFWKDGPAQRLSVLPSQLLARIDELAPDSFVARAGNGLVWYRGARSVAAPQTPRELMARIKQTYDPKNILPALPW